MNSIERQKPSREDMMTWIKGFTKWPHRLTGTKEGRESAEYVKDVFQIPDVKIFGNPETVLNRAAVLPGSGKSMTADALRSGAEVYITGDFGHHDGIDAVDQGLNVIDAGHYGIEHIFIGQMAEELKKRFPKMEIYTEPIRHPFLMV